MREEDPPIEYVTHLAKQGFRLGKALGHGLSGGVFAAEQPRLNRNVAVKFFDGAFVRGDEKMARRFAREARILAKFQHQGIPYILTEGTVDAAHGKVPYFVMEYVNGETLANRLRNQNKIASEQAIEYMLQVLDALSYAHGHQIIHRDIKPGNIMIDSRGRCFLIDFSVGVNVSASTQMSRATEAGAFLGSRQYAAPEQESDAASADERSDLYSAGVVLFEMLAGHKDRTNIKMSLSELPRHLVMAIERACAPAPKDRFESAEEFSRALSVTGRRLAPTLSPALAICPNTKCGGADWSPNGYYRGPAKYLEATNSYCTQCGHRLSYACEGCGVSISTEPHCGNCGAKNFEVPLCENCGSLLTAEFMGKSTKDGCRKCMQKRNVRPSPFEAPDDDIPF